MNKKLRLALILGLILCLLGGCSGVPLSGLDALYRRTLTSSVQESPAGENSQAGQDTVTISREQYERYRQFDELLELMDTVNYYYYKEPDTEKMLQGASAGLLSGVGDPYTFYYDPESWEKMWEEDEGEYAGVGILISSNFVTGLCTIARVFKGSPAEAAGVRRGDILYRVGEELYVTPETVDEAVSIMRGTPGTDVEVTFLRNGEELTLTLGRAIINVNQVEQKMLPGDIGLIALYQFAGKCDEEFEAAVKDLTARGAKGLIIDLRDNPGGWVDAAQHIGDLFMDKGEICYLVYRDGQEEHSYPTKDGKLEIPLVILVNEFSASASEILTAALREKADATVVGVNTFGKGIVQAVLPVGTKGSGFQLTIAEYFTPEGNAVHEKGIQPDVEIPLPEEDAGGYDFADTEHDPQLIRAVEVMQEKLK